MNDMNGNRSSFGGVLGGLALGALAMYIFDPVHGNRRRALVRDKINSMKDKSRMHAQDKSRRRDEGEGEGVRAAGIRVPVSDAADLPDPDASSQSGSAP